MTNREAFINKPCHMCDNARVNSELTDDTDLSFFSVGKSDDGFRIMVGSGDNKPVRIEFDNWSEDRKVWLIKGLYHPNYCPNCGRKLDEYKKLEGMRK